jgi:transcriptional regulator with XRE-family HTH domain
MAPLASQPGRKVVERKQRKPNLLLRQARLQRGWSLQRVVDGLDLLDGGPFGVDRVMVHRWERGVKTPSPFYQERLCQLYGLSADQLGLIPPEEQRTSLGHPAGAIPGGIVQSVRWWGDALTPGPGQAGLDPVTARILTETGSSDVERRAALQAFLAMAGSVMFAPPADLLNESSSDAHRFAAAQQQSLDTATQTYRQMFQSVPAHQLTRPVMGHFQLISELTQDVTSPALRTQLLSSLGQAAQLAGRLSFDRNDYPTARAYHKLAIQAGQEGRNPEVTAYAIGCLASISIDCGYPKETLALLGGYQCQEASRRVTPTTRAWLAAVEAEGAALLGDEQRSLNAVDRAFRLLGQADGEPTPVWMGFFDHARLIAYQGDCQMHLKRADAEQTLRAAADSLAPVYTKRRSAVLADLAAHHASAGDLEPAADAVARSYELALTTDSAIYTARAGAVRRHLEQHARRHPAVTALRERLAAMRVA